MDSEGGAGPARFKGKVVIDVSNPLEFSNGAPPKLPFGHRDSLGEPASSGCCRRAHVVKAFNTVGTPTCSVRIFWWVAGQPMCMVWVLHGALSGSWNQAFRLLRK